MLTDTRKSLYSKLVPLDWSAVKWTGGIWEDVTKIFSQKTVKCIQKIFEDNKTSHVVENFRICADKSDMRSHEGTPFCDGDFYKWFEAAIYAAKCNNDTSLLNQLSEYVNLIVDTQQSDGYISTKQIINERKGINNRLSNINAFEIYNMGHLLTLACIYYRLTGENKLLEVAEKAADYLETVYEKFDTSIGVMTAVCPAHYMGLIELYRTTENEKYLYLAERTIELRDYVQNGSDDNQDRIPLKNHKKIVGHAVRATYLYAGIADLYAEKGDAEYLEMLHRVWENMIKHKFYITGGIGAIYNGASPYGYYLKHSIVHQAFGYEYQLPNITAHNETCASVGLILWAYRMFLIEADAKYMDVIERTFLNALLASVDMEGDKFFYENVLRRTRKLEYRLIWPLTRSKYISSFCCPPNVARTILQSSEYAYTTRKNKIYIGLYGNNCAKICLSNMEFELEQTTDYPYSGKIYLRAKNRIGNGNAKIMVRIPGWVSVGKIVTKNKCIYIDKTQTNTYVEVDITQEQYEIYIDFEMKARFIEANPLVEECVNQVALERGPLVYCLEECDVKSGTVDDLWIAYDSCFNEVEFEVKGRKVIALETQMYKRIHGFDKSELYCDVTDRRFEKVKARLVPYFCWDNRGNQDVVEYYDANKLKHKLNMPDDKKYDQMRIWLPVLYKYE